MPLTLTDEQVAEWRRQQEVAERNARTLAFIEDIYNDPEVGDEARAVIKKKHPKLQMGDYDTRMEMRARFEKEKKEREDAEKKAKDDEDDRTWNARLEAARQKYNLTDSGVDELKKFMTERNVYDPDVAASHIISQRPQPASDNGGFDSQYIYKRQQGDDEDSKKLFADPDRWLEQTLVTGIRQFNEPQR